MERHADIGIQDLKSRILEMGGRVEESIASAVAVLLSCDLDSAATVRELENSINRLHIRVDELCVRLLATQQPMGSDLRFIVAAIKTNADLERIGDQAVNIAGNAPYALGGNPLEQEVRGDFKAMCAATRNMVREALDAFVCIDLAKAEAVLAMDDEVDALKRTIFDKALKAMEEGSIGIHKGLELILIARNLEKIGDHASNIAEDVIYARSGRDVRHPYSRAQQE
jgi:phosphate transport system protein